LHRLLVLSVFHLFLDFCSLDLFISCHIGIEDLPLSGFKREVSLNRGISLDAALLQGQVEGLAGALLEVELVSN
jgi:hypothetical protein